MKKTLSIACAILATFLSVANARVTSQGASDADVWCTGPSGAEVCVDSSGNLIATTDDDADLGTSSLEWQDLYIDGTAYIDTASIDDISVTNGILNSDLASTVQQTTDVTISRAQAIALQTTSRNIVPAPGVGYTNIFLGALLYYNDPTAYVVTGGDGVSLSIRYHDTGSGYASNPFSATGILDQTGGKALWILPTTGLDRAASILPVENKALRLCAASSDLVPGAAQTGDIKIRTYYRVIATGL